MAKNKAKTETKTIVGDQEWEVSAESKNINWQYGDSSSSLLLTVPRYYSSDLYENISGNGAFIRQGNDLVYLTFFRKKANNSIIRVANTIKNYYTSDKEVTIKARMGTSTPFMVDELFHTNVSGYVWDTSSVNKNLMYGSKKNDSYHAGLAGGVSILDEGGKDTYDIRSLNADGENFIYDVKGNDKFYLASKKTSAYVDDEIYDYEGNDKYKTSNSTRVLIYDYKGKDSYEINDKTASEITDYKGNDKYSVNNSSGSVTDNEGNDSYTISNIADLGMNFTITDYKGNDKYNYINLTVNSNKSIREEGGKDIYNISGSNYISISDGSNYDKKRTDDTYNISNSSKIFIDEKSSESGKKIASGNDKYNFNGVDNSALLDSQVAIKDSAGNDKYNIKNSTKVRFKDDKGNDTWNLTASKNTTVSDNDGKDKWNIVSSVSATDYTLTDVKGDDIWTINNSKSIYTVDKEGADKYTISNNSVDIHLTDNSGNDKYTINDSTDLKISDTGISNDKYTFNNYMSSLKNDYYFLDEGGNDSYTVNNSRQLLLENFRGNTTYTFNNAKGNDIIDLSATKEADKTHEKNTFNIKNSSMTVITINSLNYDTENNKVDTSISDDTYNVTSSTNTWIYDYDAGNEKYNIKSNKGGTIVNDKEGNDTYTFDKLTNNAKITDGAGENDSIIISKAKSNNLIFMANYNTSTPTQKNDVKDGALFIFDKTTKGYVQINNYFDTTYVSYNYFLDGHGAGYIESIKAGKTELSSKIDAYAEPISGGVKADELGSAIANWLETNHYDTDTYSSIDKILTSNISEQFLAFVANQ